ncbi:MAG TPA: ATP-binding cassette domain-containing protein [Ktedonobacteraceae bacterium]|nr:ATP-binding cassette domain-containing protein [Ktedonobacteraceae bacterium]
MHIYEYLDYTEYMLKAVLDTHLNTFHLDINFSAGKGKTTVLLGESGAGKSTVLRLLAGLLNPEWGHISLDGKTYFDSEQHIAIPPQERPIGYVFQDYVLFPHLTTFENVAFGLRAQHLPRKVVRQRVGEALEQVHLAGYDQRRPTQLSGGQQQRVAIARALALHPQLLLLDEPLAALDVQTQREVRQELRILLSGAGITTVMVTHQYLEALLFGYHILVLEKGKVIQQGTQRDLLLYPRSSYVAELVGMNFFRGRVMCCEAGAMCTIQLQNNGLPGIEVSAALEEQTLKLPEVGDEAFVLVDPRSITLYQTLPDSSARNVFQGTIVQLLHLGTPFANNSDHSGRVRVSMSIDDSVPLLTAEVTEASASRMELSEGKLIYATFKATEARAYT